MAFLINENITLAVGEVEKLLQDFIDLVNVVLVEDESLFANIVTVSYDGPPPELPELECDWDPGNTICLVPVEKYKLICRVADREDPRRCRVLRRRLPE